LINQNTEVSQQISLWNQMGSRVIHGNLLVVPIDNSLLYVTPLYLRAASGQLPELKRVIAVYGGKVVMEETLSATLATLFKAPALGASEAPAAIATGTGTTTPSTIVVSPDAARAALEHYQLAMEKLKAGDFGGFGSEFNALGPALKEINKPAKSAH